jgi:sterol desaturase/sphingolipid hydroxylase (fatty acid hydroxylase superfamily)
VQTSLIAVPCVTFFLLLIGELFLGNNRTRPATEQMPRHQLWDWIIHLCGFLCQGAIIPWLGYLVATQVLPMWLPGGAGILPIGWWGAFLLNFVVIDFLYYWQHRWFHRIKPLWQLHRCHHAARRVDIWVTSRNTLVMHFLFVYFLFNPLLGYLVTRPDAFFVGAMVTASLDLFRHTDFDFSRIPGSDPLGRLLGKIFILPSAHRRHHRVHDSEGNYGANLILWDRLFGTAIPDQADSGATLTAYGVAHPPPPVVQFLYPFTKDKNRSPRDSDSLQPKT